ncbi:LysR substrate-binding domain-containing protein [Aquabacterium sp. A7-Y]|uniref:LysR substrate-binding domain-containing protein n=1 Tax=Aquabacterium sp. A7-Y TaxID=1349605 RepID=UPI00223D7CC2|nr:LysR substrate-binding domain-containing protein [Aquabacterium sp. A7-Y]MCW7538677.1 LysR substrate-binding domain-containing protein [Aquabacterium sp. A7-Y]
MSALPPLRLPTLDGLRAFEAVARLGSFERAAEELHVTASAVSKRVATVEELLGTQLLQRSGKSLRPSAAGKEYLEQVRAALGLLAAVPLHRRTGPSTERLRVCAPPTFARQILVPRLESFTRAHPGVELEVVLSIPYLDQDATEADIEVRNGDPLAAGGTPLMQDVVVPVAAPALIQRLPPLAMPADLRHAPLLRTPLEPWTPWFRAAGLDWPEPAQGPRLVDLGLLLEAALSGQGVALARPSLAQHALGSGTLRPLFALTVPASQPYFLLPHAEGGAAAAFAGWLRRCCEDAAARGLELLSGPD